MSSSLGEELPREMARVRDELLPLYDAIPEGIFAATMMRHALYNAAKAMAAGDVAAMVCWYQELKGFEA